MHDLDFDRIGMPVGWAMIGLGNALAWITDHGTAILGGASIVFGMCCQGYTTYLRHVAWKERKLKP